MMSEHVGLVTFLLMGILKVLLHCVPFHPNPLCAESSKPAFFITHVVKHGSCTLWWEPLFCVQMGQRACSLFISYGN